MLFVGKRLVNLNIAPQHELLEHSVRLGAIVQRVLGSPQKGWRTVWRKLLQARWNRLHAAVINWATQLASLTLDGFYTD